MCHGAAAVDQDADLATEVARELGQLARELVRDEAVGRKAAAIEPFERVDLAGLEALGVAVDADGSVSEALRPAVAISRAG